MGNVFDSSLAGWKVRGRLSIGYNCIFVTSSYGLRIIRRNRPLLSQVKSSQVY